MYKDLSLKEKAKVLLYGGKLGLTSVEDIANLYNEAIGHKYIIGGPEDSSKEKAKKLIENTKDTKYDPTIAFPEKSLIDTNIREYDRNTVDYVSDFFNSYANSEGVNRIKDNQSLWYSSYHPIRDRWYGRLFYGNPVEGANSVIKNLKVLDTNGIYEVDAPVSNSRSVERGNKKAIIIGNEKDGEYDSPEGFVLPHELIHRLPDSKLRGAQADAIDRNKNTIINGHDELNEEKYSDLQGLRFLLYDEGIYDSRGLKDATSEDIQKLREKYPNLRPLEQMNNEKAAWMINHVVQNNTQQEDLSHYASKGGPIVSPYGQWKYPGRDTIIPSNNITMDNVNYPVLGISDAGDAKIMMPWNDYKFRGSMVYEHPLIGNKFQLGGNTKPTFDLWYPTVPNKKNDTSSYDLRRAYNMLPFDEMEKFRTINNYHLPSVAYDEKTDTYTFLKRNGHPTLNHELDWYNSGSTDALEFRERYKLDTLSLPWRYIPRIFQKGGETQKYLNVPDYNVALYNTVSPLGDFPNFWGALAYRRQVKDKLKNGNIYERDYKVGDSLGEKTAMAAWAKRLELPYDEQDLPVYNGDTATLPYSLVLEIPYDTNMLKNRIKLNKALLDKYSKYRYSDVVDAAIKADLYNLDKLRETYKTGKPVGQTEFGWNSRQLVNNGEIVPIENIQSPLNVLGNYNVRYSPEERRLYYSDEYDFNQFENFVPGKPFRIRGYIDLDNNKALGGNLFKKGGIYIKPENRGKFTRLKKRTGHSASWFKAHGTPALKKMATFALNSRKWHHKHDDGGYLYSEGGFLLAPYLYNE